MAEEVGGGREGGDLRGRSGAGRKARDNRALLIRPKWPHIGAVQTFSCSVGLISCIIAKDAHSELVMH